MKCFTKEWYINGCKETAENDKYVQYMQKYLPHWYSNFSFHDSKILTVKKTEYHRRVSL